MRHVSFGKTERYQKALVNANFRSSAGGQTVQESALSSTDLLSQGRIIKQ